MSFRLKTVLGIAAIEFVLLAILVVSGLNYLKSSNENELLQSGVMSARLFATMISDAVVATDIATLDSLVESTVNNDGLVYVRVRYRNGKTLAQGGDSDALAQEFRPDSSIEDARSDGRLDLSSPIIVAGQSFGQVEIGLSTSRVENILSGARMWMFGIAAAEIVLVALFGILLGTILTRQLTSLNIGARRVAQGEFGYQVDVSGSDELADTAKSFNKMSAALDEFAREAQVARERAEKGRDRAENILNDAMDSMPQGVMIVSPGGKVQFANSAFLKRYPELAGMIDHKPLLAVVSEVTLPSIVNPDSVSLADRVKTRMEKLDMVDDYQSWESQHVDGSRLINSQRRMSDGGVVVVEHDTTNLHEANERNRQLELELMHGQKMESLGTLAGGIAHEINTPIQYVGDNIRFVSDSFADIAKVLGDDPIAGKDFAEALQEIDWSFLADEIPKALNEAGEGVKTVADIVRAVKEFSHPEATEKSAADLSEIINNTLMVSRNQWKYTTEIDCELGSGLDAVPCYPGELAQVLINLIVNAAQAIEEDQRDSLGSVRIVTERHGEFAEIRVVDNGPGIPKDKLGKIFDLFFTTKSPGAGTGQGLAICKSIIETKHGGKLFASSTVGEGTCFTIQLPLQGSNKPLETAA